MEQELQQSSAHEQRPFERFSIWLKKKALALLIGGMVLVMMAIFFYPQVMITIGSGHAGVLFERFGNGTVLDKTYPEGTYFVMPWNRMFIYDVRLQERSDKITVLSQDGLAIRIGISVRFFPSVSTLGVLHKYIGPRYVEKVVMPEIEAKTRDVISKFSPEAIYSLNREVIQNQISALALSAINHRLIVKNVLNSHDPNYVVFENLFIESIDLPGYIKLAIEEKLQSHQKALQYDYILSTETKEAERKRIEARGIADFEAASKISILKWRGLEATEKLARSNNAKIILIGTDEKLPIILNGETSGTPAK